MSKMIDWSSATIRGIVSGDYKVITQELSPASKVNTALTDATSRSLTLKARLLRDCMAGQSTTDKGAAFTSISSVKPLGKKACLSSECADP